MEAELQKYLHDRIPLSRAMQVRVVSVEESGVVLGAPLVPNINHRDTVFGGSASALAILAAWSLVYVRMRAEDIGAHLVIQRNSMEYSRPILGDFEARAFLERPEQWQEFTRMLAGKGKARIAVAATLECAAQVVGAFTGDFVALT
ncbi:MAG TPA: YiiD C-terminal domain-containing protein [Gammaproteobacteria bacterium]|nr:YiiD C-terminal domain-containing protein [Gammaproteobacteria bacterium]